VRRFERGKQPARKLKRALAADAGVSDEDIAISIGVGGPTVSEQTTLCRRQSGAGAERGGAEARPSAERKLTGKKEAVLVCSRLPAGSARWR
jgi:hypothetical protein